MQMNFGSEPPTPLKGGSVQLMKMRITVYSVNPINANDDLITPPLGGKGGTLPGKGGHTTG